METFLSPFPNHSLHLMAINTLIASLLAIKDIPTQVSESEWMDAATQERAAKKADQMLQLIGYPDWLTDPSKVILMTMMVMVMMMMMMMTA